MSGGRSRRAALLWGSLVSGAGGTAVVLAVAPGTWWLLAFPLLAWGGLFMAWSWLKLKDPDYYEED